MKTKKRQSIVYHYRGGIERGARYEWRDGYSETITEGVLYPWMTRAECRRDAMARNGKAVFYRDGKPERA
jgi:hypothetical protein